MKTKFQIFTTGILFVVISLTACKNDKSEASGTSGEAKTTESEFTDADYSSAFVGSFKMNMQTFKDGVADAKALPSSTFYSDGKLTAIDMQMGDASGKKSRIIMDPSTKTMTTLMEDNGKKMGMKMKIPEVNKPVTTSKETDVSIKETGETKEIEGYKCRKYIIESPDNTTEFWMTKQIKGNMNNVFSNNGEGENQKWAQKLKDIRGFPLEIKTQKKDSKDYVIITLSDINAGSVDASVFSTEGYAIQDMSNMSKMMEDMAKKAQH